MAGEWTSADLAGRADRVRRRRWPTWCPRRCNGCGRCASARQPGSQRNSRDQARRNISEHYDLSNELFAEFLDETMTYSSALFDDFRPAARTDWPAHSGARSTGCSTRPASDRAPGVLEIGTGWGELCLRAAARGAHVRSVTLSAEQQRLARQRVAAAGLSRSGRYRRCATTATSTDATTP